MKKLPVFQNEDEEREFWATHDLVDVFDDSKARVVSFPNLKPSTKSISIRLPVGLLEKIKMEATQRDIPYQSYIKMKLAEAFGFPR